MITVKQLKELIKDWPEVNQDGDPAEVWIRTAAGLSSPCVGYHALNAVVENGVKRADLLLNFSLTSVATPIPQAYVKV
jgi:hypothetical protein